MHKWTKAVGRNLCRFLNVKKFVDFANKLFLHYDKLWLLHKFKNGANMVIDCKSRTKYKGGAITFG